MDSTPKEEVANSLLHGAGLALSIAGLVMLVVRAAEYGGALRVTSVSIYGCTLILLYLASTIYHSLPQGHAKAVFQILDHSAIYLLIAGTYTCYTLIALRGGWGWSLFGVIWGLAVFGMIYANVFRDRYPAVAVTIYIAMGWLVVIAIPQTLRAVPGRGLVWLIMGGLFYTLGIIFFAWRRLPYHHAVWHVFVLGGSLSHFVSIYFYVLPLGS